MARTNRGHFIRQTIAAAAPKLAAIPIPCHTISGPSSGIGMTAKAAAKNHTTTTATIVPL